MSNANNGRWEFLKAAQLGKTGQVRDMFEGLMDSLMEPRDISFDGSATITPEGMAALDELMLGTEQPEMLAVIPDGMDCSSLLLELASIGYKNVKIVTMAEYEARKQLREVIVSKGCSVGKTEFLDIESVAEYTAVSISNFTNSLHTYVYEKPPSPYNIGPRDLNIGRKGKNRRQWQ